MYTRGVWRILESYAHRFLSISGHTNRETDLNKSLSLLLQSFKKSFILQRTAVAGVHQQPLHAVRPLTRNTCIAEPREARGEAHKMTGMEGAENWE